MRDSRLSRNASRISTLAAFVCVLAFAACKQKPAPIAAKKVVLPDSAEQMIFGFNAVLTDNGVSKGRLLADTAFLYQEATGTRAELRRVHATFFTPQGADDGTLTARQGTYHEGLKRLEGRGDVIIIRKDGNRLESQQLVYDNARDQIFSDSAFKSIQPNKRVLSGIGFESDPKLTNVRCVRNCKVSGAVSVPR
ncbi:MAG: LPS export ABC transporter periplasmic protein LptC [Gemmatimonadaceae bacterium]